MAVLQGGIFSRPRGKVGGIVFGAARTRQGKLVTSRLLVPPSNPNTSAQQAQRGIFSYAMDIVRRIGSTVYRTDWNRAIGQLPGFQSLQSIFMKQTSSAGDVSLVTPINLGILEPLLSLVVDKTDDSTISVGWSDTVSGNGTAADIVKIVCVGKSAATRETSGAVFVNSSNTRADVGDNISVPVSSEEWEIYVYVVGAGTASGLLSVATPFSVDLA